MVFDAFSTTAALAGIVAAIFFGTIVLMMKRFKRCPSDRILVVYGKIGSEENGLYRSAKCIHGGAAFVWPLIQSYEYIDLTPMSIEVNLTKALSKQNIRVDVPSRFTVGVSTEAGVMTNAAERLLGLDLNDVQELAKDIIIGQLRLVIATMDIEEINSDRDKFLTNVSKNVETELKKIGLKLINVNVTDIRDESGYIEALGKEAAAKAINDAKKSVAEQNRDGEIGKANADRDKDIKMAEAERDRQINMANAKSSENIGIAEAERDKEIRVAQAKRDENIAKANAMMDTRIKTSEANATAVEGENTAKITIANSDAERREREAEANKRATAAEKVQTALALSEAYEAERKAETIRAEKERASKNADIVVPAEINKKKIEIDAEADAEQIRRKAKGEADAIFFKMEAEAKGIFEILSKQAEGFEKLVQAAGGNDPKNAVLMMIADKLPELVKTQVEAIKNIKIDKVTVWDSTANSGDGKTSTAQFMSGLAKSLPPLEDLFKMSGLELPDYLLKRSYNKEPEKKKDNEK
ncbi:MAG TPA: SPFH domain-containing protein [bacterium]|nr:SPFH domain-containing protein [bacterium]